MAWNSPVSMESLNLIKRSYVDIGTHLGDTLGLIVAVRNGALMRFLHHFMRTASSQLMRVLRTAVK